MLPMAAPSLRPPLSRVRRRSSSFSESCSFDDDNNKGLDRLGLGLGEGLSGCEEDGFCSDTYSTRERRMRKRSRKDPRTLSSAARAPVASTSTSTSTSTFRPPSGFRASCCSAQLASPAASAYSDDSLSDESSSAPRTPPPIFLLPFSAPGCASSLACTPASSRMDLDPLPRNHDRADEDDDAELSRLHHLAFEQLRRETDRDGEGFVERLRRWEDSRRRATFDHYGLGIVVDQDHGSGSGCGSAGRPSSPVSSHGDDLGDDEDEDELEVTLSQPPDRASRPTGPPPEFELADLVARLSAEGLDDFSAVREYQSRCS